MAKRSDILRRHRYLVNLLLQAPTADLREPGWDFPPMEPGLALKVQQMGYRLYGDQFYFLAPMLEQFGKSDPASRERAKSGDIVFAASPVKLGMDTIIFSATTHPEFAKYRLGVDLVSPFDGYVFRHKGTTWVNINSRIGMGMYFIKNSEQILDLFACLVAARMREGKRCLLIAKKRLAEFCTAAIQRRLRAMGHSRCRVLYGDINDVVLQDPDVVPLIHYGTIGINSFEGFDCAFCLTGYYVYEDVVNSILQDVLASDIAVPIRIKTMGKPLRRWAGVVDLKHRFTNVHQLAPLALRQQELDTVIQAVGRVRPFTKPREIVTFQCDAHPALPYDHEFLGLAEARDFYGLATKRERGKAKTAQAVRKARQRGLKQHEAAKELGFSLRTVQRYWNY